MDMLANVQELMNSFVSGALPAAQFVEEYGGLWRQIRDQQSAAISRQSDIQVTLRQLNKDVLAGEMTPEEYGEMAQAQFALVEDVWVQPGSLSDGVLSHVFIEANAYEEDPEFREPYQIDEAALRETVTKALAELNI